MNSALDVLQERGFVKQLSHPELADVLKKEKITFYTGYDPTAGSLHVGHFVQLMAASHMQRDGHRPICVIGGGTSMIGDPSGKTELRSMMTKEQIRQNGEGMQRQMRKFLEFGPDKAIMVNNADWLLPLNYVEFLRDVGMHFSVNRMLAAECYKNRLEQGLTFLEFNYMLMQGYDFLHLYREYGCKLQMGGDDQWSNILAGADLIRRKDQGEAFALTFTLLTTSDGVKMGKTVKGALWLDPERTSPYEFYQYWRNIEDQSVGRCLALLTYLPMDEVRRLSALRDSETNEAKRILAYELTALIHGPEQADQARQASEALFGSGGDLAHIPTTILTGAQLKENPLIIDLMALCGLCKSKSEARRLIEGGGVLLDEKKVEDIFLPADEKALRSEQGCIIRRGKKVFHRLQVK